MRMSTSQESRFKSVYGRVIQEWELPASLTSQHKCQAVHQVLRPSLYVHSFCLGIVNRCLCFVKKHCNSKMWRGHPCKRWFVRLLLKCCGTDHETSCHVHACTHDIAYIHKLCCLIWKCAVHLHQQWRAQALSHERGPLQAWVVAYWCLACGTSNTRKSSCPYLALLNSADTTEVWLRIPKNWLQSFVRHRRFFWQRLYTAQHMCNFLAAYWGKQV